MIAIFLTIKPEFAHKIASGEKTFEFRRRLPARQVTHIFIYSSAPDKTVIGVARVASVKSGSKDAVWKETKVGAGISKKRYDAYFEGCERANAFCLEHFKPLSAVSPCDLGVMAIPQSFCYVRGVLPQL